MSFPGNWTRVTVQGRFLNLDGTPMSGRVTFTPSVSVLIDAGADAIIAGSGLAVQLDNTGFFSIEVPATDDPDVNPTGFTYAVVEPTGRRYNITVPAAAGSIDLVDVVPSGEANPGTVQVVGAGVVARVTAIEEALGRTQLAADTFAGANGAAWPVGWSTYGGGAVNIQTNAGRLATAATAYNTAGAVRSGPNDGEMLVRVQMTAVGVERWLSLLCRSTNADNAYFLVIPGQGGTAFLSKKIAGVETVLDEMAFSPVANTWYWTRLRWQGSTLSARIWADGATEPTAWPLGATDTAHTAGNVEITNTNGADAITRTANVDDFTLWSISGTGGGGGTTVSVDGSPVDTLEISSAPIAARTARIHANATAQTLTAGAAYAQVTLNTLGFNRSTGTFTETLTGGGSLTVAVAGVYLAEWGVKFASVATAGVRKAAVAVNGTVARETNDPAPASQEAHATGSSVLVLAANDAVTLRGLVTGANTTITAAAATDTYLGLTYLGA